jgi:NAD(P)-dependent dehydrogenase (short-subunit alcohol dehydrogenase family)
VSNKKKRALITGAAMGIGKAVAERFADAGWDLVLMDLAEVDLNATVNELRDRGISIETSVGSVANARDCATAANIALTAFGGLDVLSHNAGIQRYGDIEETDEALWDEVMDVNLKGAYLISRACIEMIKESSGAIVHMSSCQGLASQPKVLAYVTAKHGLIGLTHSMAVDYAQFGVRVNAVAPGAVNTPMLRQSVSLAEDEDAVWQAINDMHPLGRAATQEEIANTVMFLASDEASFITGEIVRVDGGMMARLGGSPKT